MTTSKKKQRGASGALSSSSPPAPLSSGIPQQKVANDAHPRSERLHHFSALVEDVWRLPAALERTLWLHNVVLLLVQHTLLLDERVTLEQLLLLLWTALWLGRAHLAARGDPLPILKQRREQQILWRTGIAAAGAALQLAFLRYVAAPPLLLRTHALLLVLVLSLDVASVALLRRADAQLTWPQVVLAAVETPLLTSVFSVLYSHREFLIYDRVAFALTAVSASVHTAALLAAKVAARSTAPRTGATQWSQQRGRELVAGLRRAVELAEEDERGSLVEPAKQKKKKKGAKSSSSNQLPQALAAGTNQETRALGAPLPSVSKSLLQHASVRVAALAAAQCVLLLTQVALSAFFLLSWELTSVLLLSSSHVLYTLVQLHQTLAAPAPSAESGSRRETDS